MAYDKYRKSRDMMIGQKYGNLTVLKYAGVKIVEYHMMECICECGNIKIVNVNKLRDSKTTSCGCARRTEASKKPRLYSIWHSAKQRCTNPNNSQASDYIGRGIKMCDEWINSFEQFANDVGDPPSDTHTLDRIDNNGNYEPGNTRWATRFEQNRNKRTNKKININGASVCIAEAANMLNVHCEFLYLLYNRAGYRAGDIANIDTLQKYTKKL